jgi:hypothetical protein
MNAADAACIRQTIKHVSIAYQEKNIFQIRLTGDKIVQIEKSLAGVTPESTPELSVQGIAITKGFVVRGSYQTCHIY